MDKLRDLMERHARWQPLNMYVERIAGYRTTDFPLSVENAKSLLESITKEICKQKNQPLDDTENISKLLKYAFGCLGYPETDTTRQIGTSIANVAQNIGEFRNEIGTTAHGRTLDELANRRTSIEALTDTFLLDATELVCCFLIDAFEADNPLVRVQPTEEYNDNLEFNNYWDDQYGEIEFADYSYTTSEVLYKVDYLAYVSELNSFRSTDDETNNGE